MENDLISTLTVIEKLVESFANIESFDLLIETIKVQIDLIAKHDTTGLYLYNENEHKLKLFYAKGFSKEEIENAEATALERHPGYVFKTGEVLWVNDQDLEKNPFSINSIKQSHTRSRLYVPVKSNNKIIGAFGLQSEKPYAFTEKHLALLKVFASLAGDAYLSIKRNTLIKFQNEQNEKLSILAKHTTNNVIYCDKEGKITWVNKHFEEDTGYLLNEVIGKKPGSFLTGEATEPEKTMELSNAIKKQKPCNVIITNYRKNGELYKIAIQLNPVFNQYGVLTNYVSIQQDVTELENKKLLIEQNQKKLQETIIKITETQEKYSYFLKTTNDLIISLDHTGNIKFANNSWLTKMNYTLKEILGTNIFNYIHPDSKEHCATFFKHITSSQIPNITVEYSLISKDGKKIELEGDVICKFQNNQISEINSFLKDVSDINRIKLSEEIKQKRILLNNYTLNRINSINFIEYDSFNKVLQEITNRASTCLDAHRISVWHYTGHSIKCLDLLNCVNKEHTLGSEILETDFPKYFEGIKSQFIIDASDAHHHEFTKELSISYLKPLGINSMLDIPIKINNKLWGVICVEYIGNKITWTSEDISFTKAIADIISATSAAFSVQETAKKLENVLGSLTETVWGVSLPDYKLQYISQSAIELYERPLDEWYENINLWWDVIHPEDKERVLKETERLPVDGKTNLEYRIVTPDHQIKWIFSNNQIIKDNNGIHTLMTGISGDITNKKNIENKLVDYKKAIDESAIVSITDVKGKIIYVNDKFINISKYSKEELLGADHRIVNSGFHSKEYFKDMWQTISSGNIWKGEIKNKAKDGTEYFVESTIVPFMNEEGKPYQYVAIRYESTDIVQQKLAIENQKKFYETILNNIPIDIAVFSKDHKYLFLNKEAIKDESTRNWLIGKDDFDYAKLKNLPDNFAQERRDFFNTLLQSQDEIIWLDENQKNGTHHYKERRYFSFNNKEIIIGYGVDVTKFKKQEIQLADSIFEKETLLGEIHHRVKNNLAIIDGMVELKKVGVTDLKLKEALKDIQSRIKTVALVHQKLYQSSMFSNINIEDYLSELLNYHKNIYAKTNTNQFKYNLNVKNINTDISKAITFGLIFNELLSNSFKYAFINNYLELNISMEVKDNIAFFEYADSGNGITKNTNQSGFGLKLIKTLSKQLKANINYPEVDYFKVELNFPLINSNDM